jgi:hypothetical protein
MDMKVRNYHARLCEKLVERIAPEDYTALWEVAEENYKTGKPQFTIGHTFLTYLLKKQEKEIPTKN